MTHHTRRDFMRLACCSAATASLVGGLSKFGLVSALAQGTTDYKALVCIFMFGGNDSNNMIVPVDSAGYANYQTIRANLALPQGIAAAVAGRGRRPISDCTRICRSCRACSTTRKSLAVLSNVGTLVQPTTRHNTKSQSSLPENLFSHSDQQNQWQTTQLSGSAKRGLGRESCGQDPADV